MAEPTVSLLPTAYDGSASLLGDIGDHRTLTLTAPVDDIVTDISAVGSFDFQVPCYILFADGTNEIIYVESVDVEPSMIEGTFLGVTRGARGTQASAHLATATMALTVSGKHLSMYRDAMLAAQKYQGLVGNTVDLPASPKAGEVFIAADTGKIYFSVSSDGTLENGIWQEVSRKVHAELDGIIGDSHPIYHDDAKALTWHDTLTGGHVIDGDGHDHIYGNGVGRVNGGAPGSKGVPTAEGQIYYGTDQQLYISPNTSSWVTIVGTASGAIAMFDNGALALYGYQCPPGWSRFTALDDKFPIGAAAGHSGNGDLVTMGANLHKHAYSTLPSHNHVVLNISGSTSSVGNHNHDVSDYSGGTGTGILDAANGSYENFSTSNSGSHSHTLKYTAHSTASTKRSSDNTAGKDSAETYDTSSLPPFAEVVFCIKE